MFGVFGEIVEALWKPFHIATCGVFGGLAGYNADQGSLAWAGFYVAILAVSLIQYAADQLD